MLTLWQNKFMIAVYSTGDNTCIYPAVITKTLDHTAIGTPLPLPRPVVLRQNSESVHAHRQSISCWRIGLRVPTFLYHEKGKCNITIAVHVKKQNRQI